MSISQYRTLRIWNFRISNVPIGHRLIGGITMPTAYCFSATDFLAHPTDAVQSIFFVGRVTTRAKEIGNVRGNGPGADKSGRAESVIARKTFNDPPNYYYVALTRPAH
ncbi:hypothetical protein EVAR_67709_1 [Eumeta japonica]|uniref:Uncharacterized protein n=1 Tax=Eumeta variegata TaxID=151549 RepID=A0A4C2A0Z9_EUMVA|nr:hypothetical protein EVAR_67709_1 [Eumeta japonica]